jgi:hypothetical protein
MIRHLDQFGGNTGAACPLKGGHYQLIRPPHSVWAANKSQDNLIRSHWSSFLNLFPGFKAHPTDHSFPFIPTTIYAEFERHIINFNAAFLLTSMADTVPISTPTPKDAIMQIWFHIATSEFWSSLYHLPQQRV